MTETMNLKLPLMEAGQAQKHVTHNEALLVLDALTQLTILDRDLSAPPVSPPEGARYIVGASATGLWAGQSGRVAYWSDGIWLFRAPQPGWIGFVVDESALVYWTGSTWQSLQNVISALQNLSMLGVGTIADNTNRVAVRAPTILHTAEYAAYGGNGDVQHKLNKETATDTASFLFQTNYSGRAEFGLTGSDDFSVKVSADGSVWQTALTVARSHGYVGMGMTQPETPLHVFASVSDGTILRRTTPVNIMTLEAVNVASQEYNGFGQAIVFRGTTYNLPVRRALGRIVHAIGDDSTNTMCGTSLRFETIDNSSTASAPTEKMRIACNGNIGIGIAEPAARLDVDGAVRVKTYTVAGVPSALVLGAGAIIHVSNEAGGATLAFSDGTNWRRVHDRAVVS